MADDTESQTDPTPTSVDAPAPADTSGAKLTAPAPDAASDRRLAAIDRGIDIWQNSALFDSPISRNTASWNHWASVRSKLRDAIAKELEGL